MSNPRLLDRSLRHAIAASRLALVTASPATALAGTENATRSLAGAPRA